MSLSPEEMEILVALSEKMHVNPEDLLGKIKIKKDKTTPKAQYTAKYEIIHHKCTLCDTHWESYFAMQMYDDGVKRGLRIKKDTMPKNKIKEHLYYSHRHCNCCKEKLKAWEKDKIIEVLINDRKEF